MKNQRSISSYLKKQQEFIEQKRNIVEEIKSQHKRKIEQALQNCGNFSPNSSKNKGQSTANRQKIQKDTNRKTNYAQSSHINYKNVGVSDTERMVFDKKFKHYLNHRAQYLQKAKKQSNKQRNKASKQNIDVQEDYFDQNQVLSNTGSQYQYRDASDMQAAFLQMTTGKKRQGSQFPLYHCELLENQFRRYEFEYLLGESQAEGPHSQTHSISKQRLLDYLFDEPIIMMAYSINPYQVADQIAELETINTDMLNYIEFSKFLLADREPTYVDYTRENLEEARKMGRGLKCAPIIAKWVDETGILQLLLETYKSIDMLGDGQIDRVFLAKKIRKIAETKRISEEEIIEIVNINKKIPLNRILYEIQYEERQNNMWSYQQFQDFLLNYSRRKTPSKDKLITKLILAGKYDSSYVYVVSSEVLEIVKQVFDRTQKYAEYFVDKEKFLHNVCSDPRYARIKGMWVRSESNRYVRRQTVEQTLSRIWAEGQKYLDKEEVLDFLTNRGRPKLVEYKVYLENLEKQINLIQFEQMQKRARGAQADQSSSDDQHSRAIKQKRISRKKDKLLQNRNNNVFAANKKFNVTIPMAFAFDTKDKKGKTSIRQRRVAEMIEQRDNLIKEAMKPIKVKEVPEFVKQNMYERMLKQEERQRKQRLQRFRLEILSSINVSDRLMRPKSDEPHCDFSSEQYKFIARPLPWYCEVNLVDRINKKKIERRQRILEQLINRNADFDLPEGVQKMIERQEKLQEKKANRAKSITTTTVDQCTFVPKISHRVPDFKTIHEHLHFDLENAKNIKEPIHPQPFSFENRPTKSKTTYDKPAQKQAQVMRHSKAEEAQNQQDYENIPKTQKYEALVELRRKQKIDKEKEVQKEKISEAVRKMRQDKFAPVVWRAVKKNATDLHKSRAIINERIRQFKKQEKRKKQQYENQMIRIFTKVYQRPLLVQSGGIEQSKVQKNSQTFEPYNEVSKSRKQNEQKKVQKPNYLEDYKNQIRQRGQVLDFEQDRRRQIENHQPGLYSNEDDEQYGDDEDYQQQGNINIQNLHTS